MLKEFPPEMLVATLGPGYTENRIEEVGSRKRRVIHPQEIAHSLELIFLSNCLLQTMINLSIDL